MRRRSQHPQASCYGGRRNSSRTQLRRFLERAARSVKPGQLVLDAGAGRAAYAPLFAHARYETADFLAVTGKKYAQPDYVCDLAAIPVEDERFDHVLLTQVLEHLPEPAKVLAELNRVMKPGGTLWLSAPFFYTEHERPYDYYRYTRYGLRFLLEQAGFRVRELEWLEGYLGTLGYQAQLAGKHLPHTRAAYGGGARGLALAGVAKVARRLSVYAGERLPALDLRYRFVGPGMPKNYRVVAGKPEAQPSAEAR